MRARIGVILLLVWTPITLSGQSSDTPGLTLEYFSLPGCRSCELFFARVLQPLIDSGTVTVMEHSTFDPEEFERLQLHLAERGEAFREVPVLIVGNEVLQGELEAVDVMRALEAARQSELPPEPVSPLRTDTPEAGRAPVVTRTFGAGAVLLAGLADGVNPCAFTVIAFLISSLALGGRRRRQIIAIGLSFAAGVFVTYTAMGFGALGALRVVAQFAKVATVIRWVSLALVAACALFSLYDAAMLAAGRPKAVVLRLPQRLSDRARAAVRNARRFGFAGASSFILGVTVSVFEVVCTGQVYVPTLTYLAHQGSREAVSLLLLYNVAFILPLLGVLAATWAGTGSAKISAWVTRHMAATKVAMAVVFVLLAVLMVVQGM